jgi:hypothetical protein
MPLTILVILLIVAIFMVGRALEHTLRELLNQLKSINNLLEQMADRRAN